MDLVAMSFWIATAAMLASTVFFFLERFDVGEKWKTSVTVAGLVTGVAFWHYLYMREAHLACDVTTVYRYIDWLITVPLHIVEFYWVNYLCSLFFKNAYILREVTLLFSNF